MGTTKYPDTNNQFAYRTNREAFLKGIRDRAEELWTDGYRVALDPDHAFGVFLVWKEDGLQAGNKVNAAEGTCTCRFMTDQEEHPLDPANPTMRVKCKHLKGLHGLIKDEIEYFRMLEANARLNPALTERIEHYRAQCDILQSAWNAAVAAYAHRDAA